MSPNTELTFHFWFYTVINHILKNIMVRDRSNQSSGSLEDVTVITHAIYSWSVRNKLSTTLYA